MALALETSDTHIENQSLSGPGSASSGGVIEETSASEPVDLLALADALEETYGALERVDGTSYHRVIVGVPQFRAIVASLRASARVQASAHLVRGDGS